jgi:hypothetical protein
MEVEIEFGHPMFGQFRVPVRAEFRPETQMIGHA